MNTLRRWEQRPGGGLSGRERGFFFRFFFDLVGVFEAFGFAERADESVDPDFEFGNVEPRPYVEMWAAARRGDWEEARRLQEGICAGFEIVHVPRGRSADATGIGAFKTVMQAQGTIASNEMAFPVRALEGEVKERILAIARSRGLI